MEVKAPIRWEKPEFKIHAHSIVQGGTRTAYTEGCAPGPPGACTLYVPGP